MGKQDEYRQMLAPYLAEGGAFAELESVLVAGSNLPGPRGNLELAWAFADSAGAQGADPELWAALLRWSALSEQVAPTNDPREFLPFCALQGLAALYRYRDPQGRQQIMAVLRRSAADGRWRMREGTAMGLQRIAEWDFATVQRVVEEWIEGATLAEQRAILAALAHPPILDRPERVSFCLDVSDRVLEGVTGLDRAARKTPEFDVLIKGLSYALSVFVAPAPQAGFAFLRRWAVVADPDVRRVVKTNLGKARLAKRYPEEVGAVLALLEARAPGSSIVV